jgi:hypothetical protein
MKIISISILLLLSFKCPAPSTVNNIPIQEVDKQYQIQAFDTKPFSKENLIEYIKLIDPINAEPIIQQAILETGWFKSNLFKKYNNLFGMKFANRRKTLATGTEIGHASFNHWTDSVKDYFLWRDYMEKKKGLNITDYYIFLTSVSYATEPNYIRLLKTININQNSKRS